MRTRWAAAVLVAGMLTACAEEPAAPGSGDTPPPSPTDTVSGQASSEPSRSPSPRKTEQGTKVVAADSDFGTVLFDATGQAIYIFDLETTSEPRCYDACADAWPPVLTDGAPVAGEQARQSLLGTVERADGSTQVTYAGHPLYFYAHEGKNEVKCHDIFLNGGNWYAVQPDGQRAP